MILLNQTYGFGEDSPMVAPQAHAMAAVIQPLMEGGTTPWILYFAGAVLALVLNADPWFVSLAIQAESFIKCPICLWRVRSKKWIHDVTLPEGAR